MEHQSFENEEVAKILNDNYICIKVDREERPDIDRIYMNYVQALTQHGGWPMSCWLTPSSLNPVYGGTYCPKQQFIRICQRLKDVWNENSDEMITESAKIMGQLNDAVNTKSTNQNISDADRIFTKLIQIFNRRFDEKLGGFGSAPKFPRPVEISFLLRYYYKNKDTERGKQALKMSLKTLKAMANGGMYDHLGGGFHRYSVDEYFHVPHFEKMLYDNAQLINVYLNAYQITKDAFYKRVAEETLEYILRDMKSEHGGIYSAEDADSLSPDNMTEKKEGAFYIWKAEELDELLSGDEAVVLKELYFIQSKGNTVLSGRSDPHDDFVGYNVLYKRSNDLIDLLNKVKGKTQIETLKDLENAISSGNQKLFEYRCKRARPHLDDKIICAWNGLMLSAFANAHKVLSLGAANEQQGFYLGTALKLAEFLFENLRNSENGFLYRIYGKDDIYGFSVDYSFLIKGLLDLYQCCFDPKWLQWSMELQNIQNDLFWDDEAGGYFDTVENSKHLIMRLKEEYDGAEPCAMTVAVENLLVLHGLTKNEKYLKNAQRTLQFLDERLNQIPNAIPVAVNALDSYQNGLKQVVIAAVENSENIGDTLADDQKDEVLKTEQISKYLNVLYGGFYPDTVCIVLNDGNINRMKGEIDEMYGYYAMDKDKNVMAHVCKQFMCQKPTINSTEFELQLAALKYIKPSDMNTGNDDNRDEEKKE